MSMDNGLKVFSAAGSATIHKDMKQLYDRKVSISVDPHRLSIGNKPSALLYLMFLKEKRDGTVKGQGYADNSKHQVNKEKYSSPTAAIE